MVANIGLELLGWAFGITQSMTGDDWASNLRTSTRSPDPHAAPETVFGPSILVSMRGSTLSGQPIFEFVQQVERRVFSTSYEPFRKQAKYRFLVPPPYVV